MLSGKYEQKDRCKSASTFPQQQRWKSNENYLNRVEAVEDENHDSSHLSSSLSLNQSLSLRDRADTLITLYHHTTPPETF